MSAAQRVEQFTAVKTPPQPPKALGTLENQLKKLIDSDWAQGRVARWRRHFIWAQAQLFALGIHFFRYNQKTGAYKEWDAQDQDMYTPWPLVMYASEMIATQYSKSKPRIVSDIDGEDRKAKTVQGELDKAAEALFAKYYLSNPGERQREAKLAPLRDRVWILLEYDHTAGPARQVDQLGGQEKQTCLDCGQGVDDGQGTVSPVSMGQAGADNSQVARNPAGDESQLACAACGSPNIKPLMLGLKSQGQQAIKQGEVKRTVPDAFLVDVDDHCPDPLAEYNGTAFLRYDESLSVSEAREIYPYVDIKGKAYLGHTGIGFNGIHTLRQIEVLVTNTGRLNQNSPDNLVSYGGSFLEDTKCVRSRIWLRPHAYRHMVADKATELPGYRVQDGQWVKDVVPEGSKLADIYPNGLVVHMINDQIIKTEPGVMLDQWVTYQYSQPSIGPYGPGIAPLVALNKGLDELVSIQTQASLMSSLGFTLVDQRVKMTKNKPGWHWPVTRDDPSEPLSNFIAHIATPGPGPEVAMLQQRYKEFIADLSLAPNPNAQGMTPEGMKTATGVRYQADTTNAIASPKLELFADACAQVIEKTLRLEKLFNQHPRFYGKYGVSAGVWIDPLDIPDDARFIVEEDSHQPRTREDRRQDALAYLSAGGGHVPAVLTPDAEDNLATQFMQPKGGNDYEQWAIKGQKRFDALKDAELQLHQLQPEEAAMMAQQLVAMGQQPAPPGMLILLAKAEPVEIDNDAQIARFYVQEVYLSDEWNELSELVQGAVIELCKMHRMNSAQQQGEAAKEQQDAIAPVEAEAAQLQAGIAGQQQDSQHAADAQKEGIAAARENESRQADSAEAQAQREHEATEAEKDRAHGLALERVRAKAKGTK